MKHDLEQQIEQLSLRQPSAQLDERMSELFAGENTDASETIPFHRVAPQPVNGGSVSSVDSRRPLMLRLLTTAAILVMAVLIYQTFNRPADTPVITVNNTPPSDSSEATPTETKVVETWSNVTPGELIILANGQSLQPVQYQTLERVETINPENNVRTESLVPRNEILLIPVSFD